MTQLDYSFDQATKPGLSTLEDVCENATVALLVMDDRQHCVYMNQAAELLTGFRRDEVFGQPLHNFVHHHRPDGSPYPISECPIDRAAPANRQTRGDEVFVHRDGTFYPVSFTASPINRDGCVVGTVIEVQDARPRLEQDAEREAMRAIGLLILQELDHGKIVQAVTDTATELTGAAFGAFFYNLNDEDGESYTLYALSGVAREKFAKFPLPRPTPLFGPTFRGEPAIRIADVLADSRYGHMEPHRGMPKGHLPVRSYLAVPVTLGSGEVIGGLFFGHDSVGRFTEAHEKIVESLAAQAAIGLNKARLFRDADQARQRAEREAAEKTRLYHEAADANRMKDQFLATVSHELRTPLTSILGWSEMLATGRVTGATAQKAIDTIGRNARAQAQIIEDLLDISRIVSGKLRLDMRPTLPGQAAEAAVEALRPAAIAKGITLDLAIARDVDAVMADPERLQQVVWNLISNAVKFTPKDGRIEVAVQRIDPHVAIIVSDNGTGLDASTIGMIFDRFTQVDSSSTRSHGGLGLGLAIVRHLVELQNGSIAARSPGLGKGATFTVLLPMAAAREADPPAPDVALAGASHDAALAPQPNDLAGTTLLVVEDDNDTRTMLQAMLGAAGAVVYTAPSAMEGLRLADTLKLDMIVSDIGMPGTDGYAFIRKLRWREKQQDRPAVPAVALTAFARIEDRMRALQNGFQMHVAKPVVAGELIAVLASLRDWRRQ